MDRQWGEALQRRVIAALRAANIAEVGDRIYDQPPANPEYPFLRIGHIDFTASDEDERIGVEFSIGIEAHSRESGRVQAMRLASMASDELNRNETALNLQEPEHDLRIIELRRNAINATRDADGQAWIGVVALAGVMDSIENDNHPSATFMLDLAIYGDGFRTPCWNEFPDETPQFFPPDWVESGQAEINYLCLFERFDPESPDEVYIEPYDRRDGQNTRFKNSVINELRFEFYFPTVDAGNPYTFRYRTDSEHYTDTIMTVVEELEGTYARYVELMLASTPESRTGGEFRITYQPFLMR